MNLRQLDGVLGPSKKKKNNQKKMQYMEVCSNVAWIESRNAAVVQACCLSGIERVGETAGLTVQTSATTHSSDKRRKLPRGLK